jgi:hypothetical protein
MWLRISLIVSLIILVSCSQEKETTQEIVEQDISEISTDDPELFISIPQNSGLAFVNYKQYIIFSDSLFVIDSHLSDTLERYGLDEQHIAELKDLISKTDSLGEHHASGCHIEMGWPRFFISASLKEKQLQGFLTNCYREHIFRFVDFMNDCYPKGSVINYTKEELVQTEKECEEYNYGTEN